MPADLPALTRLTEDVATAMRAIEAREAATRARRRSRWRRGFPVGTVLLALLVAGALTLRAGPAHGDLDGGTVAKACGAGATAIVTGLAARRPIGPAAAAPGLRAVLAPGVRAVAAPGLRAVVAPCLAARRGGVAPCR